MAGLLDEGKKVLGQTLERLPHFVIFLGLVAVGFSFATYEKGFHFPTPTPNWIIFYFGVGFIAGGLILYFVLTEKKSKRLKNKTTLKFNSTELTIKIADIQDAENLSNDCAFILPCNTSFVDDCVTDNKTALGAFFNKHHSEKIPQFHQKLKTILKSKGLQPIEGIHYAPSTVLILPEEFSISAKVILVASSVRNTGQGFHTDPSIISNTIYNLFQQTADQRISTFFIPIIGSGHAGLEITEALNLLILCIKFHSKKFHHPKNVYIFVREKDSQKINASFLNSF
ncbi:MAG: hypothetical protein EAY81_03315 [Bacteroidetes bacterium]|nr:MAG: hypothetical protein EAY81_03315 [Bacteroidota bacterium]